MTAPGYAAVVCAFLLAIGTAQAEPAEDTPAQSYPASLAQRPLVIPCGVYELSARTMTHHSDNGASFGEYILGDLHLRAGLGIVELFAEADFFLATTNGDHAPAPLERVAAGVLIPRAGKTQASYVSVGYTSRAAPNSLVELRGGYALRRQTSAASAVQARGGLLLQQALPDDETNGYAAVAAEVGLDAQAQLQPLWGAAFTFALTLPIADSHYLHRPRTITTHVGGRLVYTRARFDGFAGVGVRTGHYGGASEVMVGIAGRLP